MKLAFIEAGYHVLARFQGRSSLRTYMIIVIHRLFLDYRRKLWGKWRPSAEACRLGPTAQRLELLIYRDGLSVAEACETLRTNFDVEDSVETMSLLATRLPVRERARIHSAAEAGPVSDAAGRISGPETLSPDIAFQGRETIERCQRAVDKVLSALRPEDRVVLRLRFEDDVPVADIARTLCLDQKRLYRRLESLLGELRQALNSVGLSWDEVHQAMERGQCHLRLSGDERALNPESPAPRPSPQEARS